MHIGIVAYNIASFLFEYDYFDARDAFGTETAALKSIIEDLKEHPQEVIKYLAEWDTPEAVGIIESIRTL